MNACQIYSLFTGYEFMTRIIQLYKKSYTKKEAVIFKNM